MGQNLCSIVGIFTAFIQLKLYPKEPGAITEEDGRRFVVVIVDGLSLPLIGLVAIPAQGIVLVVIDIPLVIVRERELSTGGIIRDNGLRSNGSIAEIAAVFDVRMALSFIVCHSSSDKVRCGGIAPHNEPSAQGSDW